MRSRECVEVGDRALLRRFEHGPASADLRAANEKARALAAALRDAVFDEIEDIVAGATSVLVILRAGSEVSPRLRSALEQSPRNAAPTDARLHEIAVEYDGLDLDEVARLHGMAREELVRRHSTAEYTVGFIGFSPGFPYLFGLPDELATPRLATPRTRVPAGSVAIGGGFGGIYPSATPGGWRLIGRTDARLFDPHRDPPALLAPGDRVRFITRE